jgi:hypothetical protein
MPVARGTAPDPAASEPTEPVAGRNGNDSSPEQGAVASHPTGTPANAGTKRSFFRRIGRRSVLLPIACVSAFAVGFGTVTALLQIGDRPAKSDTEMPVTTTAPSPAAPPSTTAPVAAPPRATAPRAPAAEVEPAPPAPPPPAPEPEPEPASPAPEPEPEPASPAPITSAPPTTTAPTTVPGDDDADGLGRDEHHDSRSLTGGPKKR